MKTLKGIGIYTLIILGILLVIAGLLVGCMFLMPGFKMFGWTLLAKNHEVKDFYSASELDALTYTINIDASIYNVTVTLGEGKTVYVQQTDEMYGFYRPDNYTEEDFKTSISQSGTIINITSPSFPSSMSGRKSALYVTLPKKAKEYNLNVKTSTGSIVIKGNTNGDFPLKELEINTESGDVSFDSLRSVVYKNGDKFQEITSLENENKDLLTRVVPIEKILINSNKGDVDFRFGSESLKTENIYLTTCSYNQVKGASSLDALINILEKNTNENPIVLNTKNGDVTFDNVYSQEFQLSGNDVLLRANKIYSSKEFKFNSPSGLFEISSLTAPLSTITTNNIGIKLGKINGELSVTTTYGNIEIEESTKNTSLNTVHGNIKVGHAKGSVSAISEYGDIDVKYSSKAYFKNNHGSIKVEFVNKNENKTGIERDKEYNNTCDIITGNGTVNATNLTYETTLTSNGGRITAQFSEMYEAANKENNNISLVVHHKVVLNGGSAEIQVPSLKAFMFKGIGNISGSVGSTAMAANNEYKVVVGETASDLLAHFEVDAKGGKANFSTYWAS